MANILTKILDAKRQRLADAKKGRSIEDLRIAAMNVRRAAQPHALSAALSRKDRINIVAEFKRKSPSKGVIRDDLSAVEVARAYRSGGAAAISVLTEEDFFGGSLEDLRQVKSEVELPILRKDFIFDEYQLYESAAAGADALLLIVAALTDEALLRLSESTENELGMDALVEVHTKEEMQRALQIGAKLIGINNRNLRTFDVSLETSVSLAGAAAFDTILVSESGLNTPADLRKLHDLGFSGFLIGETLMRSDNPAEALRLLMV